MVCPVSPFRSETVVCHRCAHCHHVGGLLPVVCSLMSVNFDLPPCSPCHAEWTDKDGGRMSCFPFSNSIYTLQGEADDLQRKGWDALLCLLMSPPWGGDKTPRLLSAAELNSRELWYYFIFLYCSDWWKLCCMSEMAGTVCCWAKTGLVNRAIFFSSIPVNDWKV